MAKAYIFPGQGAQFTGMGKNLFEANASVAQLFNEANEILGFDLVNIMFNGTDEELKQTNVTQPAIFLHSVAAFKTITNPNPQMVAGHSLGEFSALVANNCLSFEAALRLVSIRANAMQKACTIAPSTMAAVLNLSDDQVENICKQVAEETGEIVVPANYNCPGQLVISGSILGIEKACEAMKTAGAKRALVLPVGGAFHSPLMQPAQDELAAAIHQTQFNTPDCPVYQNVVAKAVSDATEIKENLITQLTGAVKWTQCVQQMVTDGATEFIECGPGKVLQGLISKIHKDAIVSGIN
jgi:[acyl-carrier-protein] S-malonyltransferase